VRQHNAKSVLSQALGDVADHAFRRQSLHQLSPTHTRAIGGCLVTQATISASTMCSTRPGGRVLRRWTRRCGWTTTGFNPHPPRRAGATRAALAGCLTAVCFNPHPPSGAGATRLLPPELADLVAAVFQPSPAKLSKDAAAELRFNPHPPNGAGATTLMLAVSTPVSCFNPHPPNGAGATSARRPCSRWCGAGFQPSPAQRGGCYIPASRGPRRHSDRFNPHPPNGAGATACRMQSRPRGVRFQPSPAQRGGCYDRHPPRRPGGSRGFNPHPPNGAGATCGPDPSPTRSSCFNPHPPNGAGATVRSHRQRGTFQKVSTLTRPTGRVLHERRSAGRLRGAVSTLTRPTGRVLLCLAGLMRCDAVGFNPHPPNGAGATRRGHRTARGPASFNPHPPNGAGATPLDRCPALILHMVSTLTRPTGRVLRDRPGREDLGLRVSTLTRPTGRVLR
jgi:hypothetical protein